MSLIAELGLAVVLDFASAQSLRSQLTQRLREAHVAGTLLRGDVMPPSRVLAGRLGVSRGTVVSAYEQLLGEGYLEARPGSGTIVAVTPGPTTPQIRDHRRTEPDHHSRSTAATRCIDLRPGRPAVRGLSDPSWKSAWRMASRSDPAESDQDPLGLASLRVAIAEHLRHARGYVCDPEDIIVTAGTSDAMALIAVTLARAGRRPRVAVENPGYPKVRTILTALNADVIPVTLSGGSLSLESLERAVRPDAVVVTPSHHYPMGGRMPVRDRIALLNWAADVDAVIIEDDYDSEFRYDLAPLPALASLDSGSRVTLVGSFSKVLTPSLRCGYLVSGGAFGGALREVRAVLDSPVSLIQQLALSEYIRSGALSRHISRSRREYRHRRDLLVNRIGAVTGVEISGIDGGLHAVIRVPLEARRLAATAAEHGVVVSLLSEYWCEPIDSAEDAIVLGYAAPTSTELGTGLDILKQIIVGSAPGSSAMVSVN